MIPPMTRKRQMRLDDMREPDDEPIDEPVRLLFQGEWFDDPVELTK